LGEVNGSLEEGVSVLTDLATMSSTRILKRLRRVYADAIESGVGEDFRGEYDTLRQKAIMA
jgi:hypothetical protein